MEWLAPAFQELTYLSLGGLREELYLRRLNCRQDLVRLREGSGRVQSDQAAYANANENRRAGNQAKRSHCGLAE
jgi:hypothetical protein